MNTRAHSPKRLNNNTPTKAPRRLLPFCVVPLLYIRSSVCVCVCVRVRNSLARAASATSLISFDRPTDTQRMALCCRAHANLRRAICLGYCCCCWCNRNNRAELERICSHAEPVCVCANPRPRVWYTNCVAARFGTRRHTTLSDARFLSRPQTRVGFRFLVSKQRALASANAYAHAYTYAKSVADSARDKMSA